MKADLWTGSGWVVELDSSHLTVRNRMAEQVLNPADVERVTFSRFWPRSWSMRFEGQHLARLRGLNRHDVRRLKLALRALEIAPEVATACAWRDHATTLITNALVEGRWISRETFEDLVASRPARGLLKRLERAGVEGFFEPVEIDAARLVEADLSVDIRSANEHVLENELRDRCQFFSSIEASPLTEEQARAVVTFDNRVLVVASAGSGKTSVMVARAAYAVARDIVRADRILLLAFNKAAAEELQQRITNRFAAVGLDGRGLRASTFHSFGLDAIGRATGRKPRLAEWLEGGRDLAVVEEIVDGLRDSSTEFRYKWDLFRLLFAGAPNSPEAGDPDAWDAAARRNGFRTLDGKIVRSDGERLIADWLFLNGVEYAYERPYVEDVADESHSQYRPDFYYPTIDAWHEHWALDTDGNPPVEFVGYAEGMEWKRNLHRAHGTTLLETTWAEILSERGFAGLEAGLRERGITLDWNPERRVTGRQVVETGTLAALVRTFMTHVKSNSLTREDLVRRASRTRRKEPSYRNQLFFDIYWPIHDEWQRRLRSENLVDFEDMLVLAADCLERGDVEMPYDLVMVDEFQDASHARARVVRALLRSEGKYLLAVGDDWQSINRFAGADLSVMTEFEEWFGSGPTLQLTTTFRCPQNICDVAGAFVGRNPRQIRKTVRSAKPGEGASIRLIQAGQEADAVDAYLTRLSKAVEAGDVVPEAGRKVSVQILGRYRFDRRVMPSKLPRNLDVTFRTVHGSKGLEADFVILARLSAGTYGFPSTIADDAVLDLVMADPDDFPHSEERRLFYVGLTRARREVALITRPVSMSPFVVELIARGDVRVDDAGVSHRPVHVCPRCVEGVLVTRNGPYGTFYSCSRFPACTHKQPSLPAGS